MKTIAISLFLLLALSGWAFAECTTVYRSSWISELCFDSGRVTATMTGKRYAFCGMSRATYDDWVAAPSVGKHYQRYIRGKYVCR